MTARGADLARTPWAGPHADAIARPARQPPGVELTETGMCWINLRASKTRSGKGRLHNRIARTGAMPCRSSKERNCPRKPVACSSGSSHPIHQPFWHPPPIFRASPAPNAARWSKRTECHGKYYNPPRPRVRRATFPTVPNGLEPSTLIPPASSAGNIRSRSAPLAALDKRRGA